MMRKRLKIVFEWRQRKYIVRALATVSWGWVEMAGLGPGGQTRCWTDYQYNSNCTLLGVDCRYGLH